MEGGRGCEGDGISGRHQAVATVGALSLLFARRLGGFRRGSEISVGIWSGRQGAHEDGTVGKIA